MAGGKSRCPVSFPAAISTAVCNQPFIQFDCVWFQTELDPGFTKTASRQWCGHKIDGRLHGGLRQASFNKTLFHAVGDAIGTEARAMSNVGAADGWTFW
jgi:hypothetical protein